MNLTKNIRKWLRTSGFVQKLYYSFHLDDLSVMLKLGNFEKQLDHAIKKFRPDVLNSPSSVENLKKEVRHSYYVCKSSPDEYFLMGLYDFDDKGKKAFVTDKFLFMTMARVASRKKHDEEIEDKFGFYNLAKTYFKRQVVMISSISDFDSFHKMALDVQDMILKPLDACMGKGIEAVTITNESQAKEIFHRLISKGGKWLAEERIKQVQAMADWNESCVNTVRFLSFLNPKTGFNAITPFFRTGRRGSVVDNAGSGGIFANVDAKTGVLCTCGIDEMGNRYEEHPDSHMKYQGWQIPQYDELVTTVKWMHQTIMPAHPYIGWDLALTDKGWVVIEANWGQLVNQYVDHIGRKKEFMEYVTGEKYSIS